MSRAKNTINAAEVSSIPIKLRYTHTHESHCFEKIGITAKLGINVPFTASVSMAPEYMEPMTNYRMIRQVYYQQSISGSVLNSSSIFDPFWVSTAASGTLDTTNMYFPTEESASIGIISIPPSQFGEQISRRSFRMFAEGDFDIIDDGNGNLVDLYSSSLHVGNVFYAQGIAVITNEDYVLPYDYLMTEDQYVYETENDLDIMLEEFDIVEYLITEEESPCATNIYQTQNNLDIILQ